MGQSENGDENLKKKEPHWSVFALGAILYIWAVVHVIRTRSIQDFLHYPLYIILPITGVALVVAMIYWWKSGFKFIKDNWGTILFFPIFVIFIGVSYYITGAALKDVYLFIKSPSLSKGEATFAIVFMTFIVGVVLFYFRLRLRSIYGITEAVVGMAIAGYKFSSQSSTNSFTADLYLALLTASVYLVVRGLDNVHQGLTKDPKDTVALRMIKYMNLSFKK